MAAIWPSSSAQPGRGRYCGGSRCSISRAARTVLDGETRNIDDQVEWLDRGHVIYAIPDPNAAARTNVFRVSIEGGAPVEP